MAPHSSTLAWKIPWTEEPGGLQSIGSQRFRHNLATKQQPTGEYTGGFILHSMLEKNIFTLKHKNSILEKTTELK